MPGKRVARAAVDGPAPRKVKAPNPSDKYVGSRVRMRRMHLGLSQDKLGEAIGLTFQQVQKYEKGTNRIGSSRLMQIASVLEVPVSFFFEGAPAVAAGLAHGDGLPAAATTAAVEFWNSSEGVALSAAFIRITDRDLRSILRHLVESVASHFPQWGEKPKP